MGISVPLTLLYAAEVSNESAKELIRKGNRYVIKGKYQDATRIYKRVYDKYQDPDAAYNLGIVYHHYLHFNRKAAIYYREFLRMVPDDPDKKKIQQWINQSISRQGNKNSPRKIQISEAAKYILEDPQAGPLTKQGNQALKNLNYKEAVNKYQKAVILNNSTEACYNMALMYDLDLKYYTRAIYYYQKSRTLTPDSNIAPKVAKRIKTARSSLNRSKEAVSASLLFPLRGSK